LKLKSHYITNLELSLVFLVAVAVSPLSCCIRTVLTLVLCSACCCLYGGGGYFTTDDQSARLGIEHPCGTWDQILLPVGILLSQICGLVPVGRSAICSVIT
jgi:hypothetical protein